MIMDVDAPNLLKRCSSAPLINEVPSTSMTSPSTNSAPRSSFFSMFSSNPSRTRRFSGSYSPLTPPGNATNSWGPRMAPRVSQLRLEECADASNTREVAHEREVHTAMQMGQSCEDLTLVAGPLANSPTRQPRFSPAVSPSPTRKYTTRRSLSPIQIRASSFSPVSRPAYVSKRRCDEADSPACKRMCTGRLTPGTPVCTGRHTPGTPMCTGRLTPGTPDSDSLECTFRPVSPRAQPMSGLDSPLHAPPDSHGSPDPS